MNEQVLIDFVLEFARSVDGLQRKYAPELAEDRQTASEVFAAYHQEMEALYTRFLTPRKRHCYYFGLSDPPEFHGLEDGPECVADCNGNRAEITILSAKGGLDYRFNLRCRDGAWRINSFQQRVRTARQTYQWEYGCF